MGFRNLQEKLENNIIKQKNSVMDLRLLDFKIENFLGVQSNRILYTKLETPHPVMFDIFTCKCCTISDSLPNLTTPNLPTSNEERVWQTIAIPEKR